MVAFVAVYVRGADVRAWQFSCWCLCWCTWYIFVVVVVVGGGGSSELVVLMFRGVSW